MAKKLRCAIYTRKSTEEGLDQAFNSLDAQREAFQPTLPAKSMKAGRNCQLFTMTVASPAVHWSDPR